MSSLFVGFLRPSENKNIDGRSSSSISSIATASVTIITLASIAAVGFGWTSWRDLPLHFLRGNNDGDESENDDSSFYNGQEGKTKEIGQLPQHLRRAVWKEQKRKESVRFLAMKKPMYDNIEMYDPQGDLLCTIAEKKANWYVKKELGSWNKAKTAIHLHFQPKGKSENVYNQSQKRNVCVSCGDDQHHMRHYVVPYCYRTLLPEKYKTHMPHDIVIMWYDIVSFWIYSIQHYTHSFSLLFLFFFQ